MNNTATTLLAAAATAAALAQEPAPAAAAAAPNPQTPAMQIDSLLSGAGAFFLATADGDQPKLRPLGAHQLVDGKVWLGVGEFKNVYRQLAANPKCEVVALQPEGGKWLRWTGRAVFAEGAERERLEEIFLDAMPHLRKIYDKTPGKRMMCFTLADARAELVPLMPPGEILLDEPAAAAAEWDKTFPLSDKVEHAKVSFRNRYGIALVGDVYKPKGAAGRLPAVAVTGPFGAVKEQCSGLYAQHLAEHGFLALAFDPSFTGESGGAPRRMASPDINTEDFLAAVDCLSVRDDVDPEKIGILSICGFGGMAVNAAALDPRIKATVASTMYDMTKVSREGYFGSTDTTAARMEARRAMAVQRTEDYKAGTYKRAGGVVDPLPEDAPWFVKDYHAYYKTPRGFHPRSGNSTDGWNVVGCQSFLNQPILSYAREIATPVLLIHGEKAHSRYFSEYAFEKMTGISVKGESAKAGNKELLIVPGASHVDLYDDVAGVIPHDRIADFFRSGLD